MVQGGGLYGFDGIRRTAELMVEAFTEEKDTEDLVVRKGWGCESLYGFDGIRRTAELMMEAYREEKDTEKLVVQKGWGCECCL